MSFRLVVKSATLIEIERRNIALTLRYFNELVKTCVPTHNRFLEH